MGFLWLGLVVVLTGCGGEPTQTPTRIGTDAETVLTDSSTRFSPDSATPDSATPDTAAPDAGTPDAGTPDAGTPDAGTPDAGTPDAGTPDAGTPDAGTPDAGTPDTGTPDTGTPDAGTPDAGTPDAGTPDAGTPDAGTPDAGKPDVGTSDTSPACTVKTCNDNNPCTADTCNPAVGCSYAAKPGTCSDGDACTLGDSCQKSVCKPGKPASCNDGKPCTVDACSPKTGCSYGPDCAKPLVCLANTCGKPAPLPYPVRTAYQIKAIQPDFWPTRQDLIGNRVGGIGINFVWAQWQPVAKKAPCATNTEVAYDGWCFKIQKHIENEIAAYNKAGVHATGVFYGVPAWARIADKDCSPAGGSAGFKIFCKPKDPKQYGRFVGFIASRYDGLSGVGRVIDFVIHNEVNSNTWFDIGCGDGKPCNTKQWLDDYAKNYNAAYDRVTVHQPDARVLISLEHHWDPKRFDRPAAKDPLLSGQTFLKGFAARVGKRKWRVAYHPYPPNLLKTTFGPLDHINFGRVTYGNIGVLLGWLHQTFPNAKHTHEVQLTESGVNGIAPHATQSGQAAGVCLSFRTVLATPGIINYLYHRMRDHPVETASGLGLGLFDANNKAKAAWNVWAMANRNDLKPPQLSCGFELLPFVRLQRGYDAKKGHWATTRLLPAGFKKESSWRLKRAEFPGSKLLFSCQVGSHNLISIDPGCEGLLALGPVGYAASKAAQGLVPLRRCRAGSDHFISSHPTCEGQVFESILGWVWP